MPLFDEGGNTGAHYQSAWSAFTGLFDKKRRGKPTPQNQQPEDEPDVDLKQDDRERDKW